MKTKGPFREFRVIGCKLPTEEEPETPLYRMRIFAPTLLSPNLGFDQAWFWYFLRQLRKFKKTTDEIASVEEITEKKPLKIKNFGVWIRYDSRSGTYMYREYRRDPMLPRYGSPSPRSCPRYLFKVKRVISGNVLLRPQFCLLKVRKSRKKKYVVLDYSEKWTLGQFYVLEIAPAFVFWKNPW